MTNQDYVNLIKAQAVSALKADIVSFIISKFPFMAAGPLGTITAIFASKIAEYVIGKGELAVFFAYIDLRTSAQGRDFSRAVEIHHSNPTPETEKALNEAFKRLVVLTN